MTAPADATPGTGAPRTFLLVLAVVLLAGYVVSLVVLFLVADDVGVGEPVWSRYVYLLSGLEAVVFTAVGWLFGREVNRGQAEQAQRAVAEATEARKAGEGLRQAVLVATDTAAEAATGPLTALRTRAERATF